MRTIKIMMYCLSMLSCAQYSKAQAIEYIKSCDYEGYIFPKEHIWHSLGILPNGYNLNRQQISDAEHLMAERLEDIKPLCPKVNKRLLKKYIRQYWGTTNENGDIVVNIYLIHPNLVNDINIGEDIVYFFDGGCNIINAIINLTNGSVIFSPNGVS